MDKLLEVLSREFNQRITKDTIAKLGWAIYLGTLLVWFKSDEEANDLEVSPLTLEEDILSILMADDLGLTEVILTAVDLDLDEAFEFLELCKA